MNYRPFGKLQWEGSILGFGAMRLPVLGNSQADIDEAQVARMIHYAVDHGVNYVDTAYFYHEGRSEPCIGRALKDGYRDRVMLATKLPSWLIFSHGDFDRYLNEQLARLETNHIDFYLLHGLNRDLWPWLRDLGVLRWAEGAMADGRIGHLGFSFHDDYSVFKEIVDAYDQWTMCQIQLNYMDVEFQAGLAGLRYAADKGLAVVVMEPLRGGQLTKEQPAPVAKIWAGAPRKRSLADWALRWVWHHPEVAVVLSGMSTLQQVEENVAIAEQAEAGTLSPEELGIFDEVRRAYRGLSPVDCTGCRYCMPCQSGVNIPRIFEIYNDAVIYDDLRVARFLYRGPTGLKEAERGDKCNACGTCEDLCPQQIPIQEWLGKAHELLGPRK
jgi:predicted aldo/keto reductase-like oxidoreductase